MAIVLGSNQYGKAEVRLVHVDRSTPTHFITDINVTSQLMAISRHPPHGANNKVIATDTQKNTAYALAQRAAYRASRNSRCDWPAITWAPMTT